jgi:hypothetical protein
MVAGMTLVRQVALELKVLEELLDLIHVEVHLALLLLEVLVSEETALLVTLVAVAVAGTEEDQVVATETEEADHHILVVLQAELLQPVLKQEMDKLLLQFYALHPQ